MSKPKGNEENSDHGKGQLNHRPRGKTDAEEQRQLKQLHQGEGVNDALWNTPIVVVGRVGALKNI